MKNSRVTSSHVQPLPPLDFNLDDGVCVPDLDAVSDWDRYLASAGLSRIDAQIASHMFGSARAFLVGAKWCDDILEEYVGLVHPGTIGVFLFRLSTPRRDIGEWGWVIVGPLPTGFIASRKASTAPQALQGYVAKLGRWADAQRLLLARDDLDDGSATALKSLDRLKTTLAFVEKAILPTYGVQLAFSA